MVLHGLLSDSYAARVFCGQSEMPVSGSNGEVCAARSRVPDGESTQHCEHAACPA